MASAEVEGRAVARAKAAADDDDEEAEEAAEEEEAGEKDEKLEEW